MAEVMDKYRVQAELLGFGIRAGSVQELADRMTEEIRRKVSRKDIPARDSYRHISRHQRADDQDELREIVIDTVDAIQTGKPCWIFSLRQAAEVLKLEPRAEFKYCEDSDSFLAYMA